jgi:hypothetical protein
MLPMFEYQFCRCSEIWLETSAKEHSHLVSYLSGACSKHETDNPGKCHKAILALYDFHFSVQLLIQSKFVCYPFKCKNAIIL